MNRRATIAAVTWAMLGAPVPAQSPNRVVRVGFLHPGSPLATERMAAVREGFGGVSGLAPEFLPFIGDGNTSRMPALADEAVAARLDVLVATSRPGVLAAAAATGTMPIVAVDLESDPVASGWVSSLARPGGNVSGIFLDLPGLSAKCVELLREIVPGLRRAGVLWDPAMGDAPLSAVRQGAAMMNVEVEVLTAAGAADLDPALRSAAERRLDGLVMVPSPLFGGYPQRLAELSAAYRLPAINAFPEFAKLGGLSAYGPDLQGLFRQGGAMARKVAEGSSVRDLPVQRPVRFQLVVNAKAAAALGLAIPSSLLARADEVIE